jgi:hypothetical protein
VVVVVREGLEIIQNQPGLVEQAVVALEVQMQPQQMGPLIPEAAVVGVGYLMMALRTSVIPEVQAAPVS